MAVISRTNQDWVSLLSSSGEEQAGAIAELHQLLLRAVHYTFSKYLSNEQDQERARLLAEDCAQEALITLLDHLPEFRGESKFTTWAFKFGINKAIAITRREQWRGISLDQMVDGRELPDEWNWSSLQQTRANVEHIQAQKETWEIVWQVIQTELTERQRQVLVWMVFDEVPMDVVSERLETNRNAVYKMLHDARQRVKSRLEARGYTFEEILHLFAQG